jgi:hypothetical protein
MPSDAIYLISDSGELRRIEHQLYANEDILQDLVAKHPEVLAGDQIDPAAPPRWLLIRREATIPDSADGDDRWWLDHLLLDQFGVPTLVEVKRSTDTRIRREVVGQMLDYVANAQAYWAAGRMRQMLTDQTGSPELADLRLANHLGTNGQSDALIEQIDRFWNKVEANLREGNVRLLFVADELPPQLKRLIEFLNEQFTKIEVLGVELRQYVGQGVKALVPRVIGQSEAAREQKARLSPSRSGAPSVRLDRETFLASCPPEASNFFASVLDEAANRGLQVSWKWESFQVYKEGGPRNFFYCKIGGYLEIYPKALPEEGVQLRSRLLKIPTAEEKGRYTIHIPVRRETLSDAKEAWDVATKLMVDSPDGQTS